jgi:hypothetical protein
MPEAEFIARLHALQTTTQQKQTSTESAAHG